MFYSIVNTYDSIYRRDFWRSVVTYSVCTKFIITLDINNLRVRNNNYLILFFSDSHDNFKIYFINTSDTLNRILKVDSHIKRMIKANIDFYQDTSNLETVVKMNIEWIV